MQIFEALGTPDDSTWAGVERLQYYRRDFPRWQPKDWAQLVPRLARDPAGADLLASMLSYNPESRITAGQALKHPWFEDIRRSEALRAGAIAGPSAQQQAAPLSAGPGPSRLLPIARSLGAGVAALQQQPPHVQLHQQYQSAFMQQQQQQQASQVQHSAFAFGQQHVTTARPVGPTANWVNMPLGTLQPVAPQTLQHPQQLHQPLPA